MDVEDINLWETYQYFNAQYLITGLKWPTSNPEWIGVMYLLLMKLYLSETKLLHHHILSAMYIRIWNWMRLRNFIQVDKSKEEMLKTKTKWHKMDTCDEDPTNLDESVPLLGGHFQTQASFLDRLKKIVAVIFNVELAMGLCSFASGIESVIGTNLYIEKACRCFDYTDDLLTK